MLKNKKNGFTLIELIATITLLAVLAMVILANMVGIKTNEDNRNAERFQKSVEEAACAYIDMMENVDLRQSCKNDSSNSECKITLGLLSSSNVALIDSEEVDPYTNMLVKDEPNIYVQVSWINKDGYKEKKCTMYR